MRAQTPEPLTPDLYTRATAAADFIRAQSPVRPRIGIILGSGLGAFASAVESATTIPYATIPHFPQSTVEGHSGNLLLGSVAGVPVAVMQGRVHAYEGYTMPEVTFPTRVLGLLGCTILIVTNTAGGIKPTYPAGALVLITDHINLTGSNAALGPNEPRFATTPSVKGEPTSGLRFFDMTAAYTPALRTLAHQAAATLNLPLHEGVYLAVLGPSYETPAEIRAFRTLGADLVGMSTVHEVIVARHMGMQVLGLSLVTNAAAGVTREGGTVEPIHHTEVMDIGRQVESRFANLLTTLIPRL